MTRTTIATVLATALTAALLSGCGGSGDPSASGSSMPNAEPAPSSSASSPAPSPSSSSAPSSPTSSPKPSTSVEMAGAPGVPKAARYHTKAGAEAFVRHYVDLINQTGLKPEHGRLEPLATPGCKTCNRYEGSVDYMVKHNLHYSDPIFKVNSVHALKDGPQNMRVAADLTQRQMRVLRADGSTFQKAKSEPAYFTFVLHWTQRGWRSHKIFGSGQ